MNGIFDNGPIPPEAMEDGNAQSKPLFCIRITKNFDPHSFDIEIKIKDGGGKTALGDLEAKAAAFRADMIERVTRKTEADE